MQEWSCTAALLPLCCFSQERRCWWSGEGGPGVLEHCRKAQAGCWSWNSGWALSITLPPGNCSLVGEFSAGPGNEECAVPPGDPTVCPASLTGAGDETAQDSGLVWASCFSSGSCQPGDWAETFSAQMQELFITFSALHLAATASQRALGRGNDLASGNGDLFPEVLYCNIFLLSDCTVEAPHSYHAGSSWGSLILFF